ncbi:MAG: C4-dicarboxylate transporter DcuC [Turicibacter sp.]|nr:C4-dicarboxylate transporter DcuC [Turicibacter sp.]
MMSVGMTLIVLILAGYLIKKKYDIKWIMFGSGILLMIVAIILRLPLLPDGSSTTIAFFDIFKVISHQFTTQLTGASFILMLLFGYTSYMKQIGANQMTVDVMSKALSRLKYKELLLPLFYLIGNVLGLIIPSASSLSVLLMATAYPILVSAGVSPLGVAAVISMSAMIAPTPLGADNILAAQALDMTITEYVFNYHAKISLPIIFILAIVHYAWQRYLDKKEGVHPVNLEIVLKEEVNVNCPKLYAILPMLPLILMMIFNFFLKKDQVGMVEVTLCSFLISIICEMIRLKSPKQGLQSIQVFFNGMGTGFTTVVIQVVAALTFVEGLKIIGVIDLLTDSINQLTGAGIILTIFFCLLALGVGLLSGSGLALFYACVELMPSFAASAGMNSMLLAIPMQFVSHLVKCISPVAPTVIIISSMMNVSPLTLIKRTIVPAIIGMLLSIVLPYLVF